MSQLYASISAILVLTLSGMMSLTLVAQESSSESQKRPAALIDGNGPGWQKLTFEDFVNVNCKPDTWSQKDGIIVCNGNCNGGLRTQEPYTNFEMVMQWKHLRRSGNSGVFIWSPKKVLDQLQPGALPQGIEIQILDQFRSPDLVNCWAELKLNHKTFLYGFFYRSPSQNAPGSIFLTSKTIYQMWPRIETMVFL